MLIADKSGCEQTTLKGLPLGALRHVDANSGMPGWMGPFGVRESHPVDVGTEVFGDNSGATAFLDEDAPARRERSVPAAHLVDGCLRNAQGVRHMLPSTQEFTGPPKEDDVRAHDAILAPLAEMCNDEQSTPSDDASAPADSAATLSGMIYDPEADGKRLKALFDELKKRTGISRAEFAEKWRFGSEGNLGHYFAGRNKLDVEPALRFARALSCRVDDFSRYWAVLARREGHPTDFSADAGKAAENITRAEESMAIYGARPTRDPSLDEMEAKALTRLLHERQEAMRVGQSFHALHLGREFDKITDPAKRERIFALCMTLIESEH